eukprot:2184328-Pyramimonas_sp.AAC.1
MQYRAPVVLPRQAQCTLLGVRLVCGARGFVTVQRKNDAGRRSFLADARLYMSWAICLNYMLRRHQARARAF